MFKRLAIVFSAIIVILAVLAGCDKGPATPSLSQNEFIDQAGRTVKLDKVPQKIISLAPSNTETLFAIGLADRIIGVTDYCNYPPEALNKPKIGGFWTPNIELIVSLAPDLVVAQSNHVAEIIPQLEKYNIPVVVLDPQSLDDVLAAITLMGKMTGNTKEASALVKSMESRINQVVNRTKDLAESQKPKVFFITWHDPLITVGSPNFIEDLIYKAGGVNIFHHLTGSPTVSLEDVVQANPDVIIASVGMGTGEDQTLRFALDEPRLAQTNACINDQVYSVITDVAGRPGPRIIDALEDFLGAIHPELRTQPN